MNQMEVAANYGNEEATDIQTTNKAFVQPIDGGNSIFRHDAQILSNLSSGGLIRSNDNNNETNGHQSKNNILSRPSHSKIHSADLDSVMSPREHAPVQPQYNNKDQNMATIENNNNETVE